MLYTEKGLADEEHDFIFSAKPYNEDIDIKEVAAIEGFLKGHGYIPTKYIPTLLNWLTYRARYNVTNPGESPLNSSYVSKCAVAQGFYNKILDKLGLDYFNFNIGDVFGVNPIHALTVVNIPTIEEGNVTTKAFILDPTFRQFCLSEENRFERYNEEPRWSVRMSTPHPGYFFKLTEKGGHFAENLICHGYFEATDENLKQYFDPFALYLTPKEYYERPDLVGKISDTQTTGDYYRRMVREVATKDGNYSNRFDTSTPLELVERERNKFKNKVKRFFNRGELEEMFVIDSGDSEEINLDKNKK